MAQVFKSVPLLPPTVEGYVEDEDAIDWAALSSSSRSSDDEGRRHRHGRRDADSDFVADDDSGSDWEEGRGNKKPKVSLRYFVLVFLQK